jgi:hypothetical protein
MRRCGDCPYAERKCGKQIRRHVERCVSDKIRTVSARLPRRSTSGQRDHSGCQHRRFPLWSRFAQWLGESHRVHGRELRRRIGTSFGQFRQRNLARSHGKRELRRRLDCAATIIAPANVGASAPRFPSRVRFRRKPAAAYRFGPELMCWIVPYTSPRMNVSVAGCGFTRWPTVKSSAAWSELAWLGVWDRVRKAMTITLSVSLW